MVLENQELAQKLSETGKYLLVNQLAWGTSGNMSARIDEKQMLITSSGTNMGNLSTDDFTVCTIDSGDWSGLRKPSKEVPMHKGIYQERKDARVILHSSPFYTTLLACSGERIMSELFIETMYYLENVAFVDYHHPGTKELGDAVKKQAACANIMIMKNHGVILFDDSFSDAIMRLETLEMTCRMIVTAKSAGVELKKIPDHVVQEFREKSIYKPRKSKIYR
ncbi:class II aldolase/adducin family protein [Metabacillus arenae]|uniref:Class II aldolase/adducin family protein n=1 Tax=Metabacillus arenae TaxID=2771434 RepID=A0A926NCZ6_9BACI|nr:class II aldolase/adducin family protein [Metabacillus arenae]MBD1381982.1 class II aldolase/adducin family protein [Metabacillus arenae]